MVIKRTKVGNKISGNKTNTLDLDKESDRTIFSVVVINGLYALRVGLSS